MAQIEDEALAGFRVRPGESRVEGADLKAVDEGGIVEGQPFGGCRLMHDGTVRHLPAPGGAGQMERPVGAVLARQGEVEMMAGVIGQGLVAGVARLEANFEEGAGLQADDDIESEGEGIESPRGLGIDEAHAQGPIILARDDRECSVAGEAMLGHRANRAGGIAPEFVFALDEMAGEERKKDRVAAAHFEDFAPVGVVGPGNDLASGPFPAEKPRAVVGRDKHFIFAIGQLDHRLVLEMKGAFHINYGMSLKTMPSEPIVSTDAIAAAYAECTRLARAHYENFPVGRLVPREMQPHVHAVYAFARHADDLADEGYAGSAQDQGARDVMTPKERLAALDDWERQLCAPRGTPGLHPIFVALHETIRELDLPRSLFTDLLSAFKQDVFKRRYANFPEVLDYCRRSANPVGRLVLLLHRIRDENLHLLADKICTGLQLANFWQDVGVDLEKDRIYLPQDDQARFGVAEEALFAHRADDNYRKLLAFQVARTQEIFDQGALLTKKLRGLLRIEIRLTWLGGTTVLRKIEALQFDTLNHRPKIGKGDMAALFLKALVT